MSYVLCHIHQQPFARASCHEHHETPQAAGGKHLGTVWVCANCHTVLHRVEQKLRSGKMGMAKDIANSYAPQPAMRARLLELATVAQQAMNEVKEGTREGRATVPFTFDLEPDAAAAFKTMVKEYRQGGRSVGVNKFLRALVMNQLVKRGFVVKGS